MNAPQYEIGGIVQADIIGLSRTYDDNPLWTVTLAGIDEPITVTVKHGTLQTFKRFREHVLRERGVILEQLTSGEWWRMVDSAMYVFLNGGAEMNAPFKKVESMDGVAVLNEVEKTDAEKLFELFACYEGAHGSYDVRGKNEKGKAEGSALTHKGPATVAREVAALCKSV